MKTHSLFHLIHIATAAFNRFYRWRSEILNSIEGNSEPFHHEDIDKGNSRSFMLTAVITALAITTIIGALLIMGF